MIPNKLRVCGVDYTINICNVKDMTPGCSGIHNSDISEIRILGDSMSVQRQQQIFFHELMHAIDVTYNNNKLTEDQVDVLANGIYQVLSDNNLLNSNIFDGVRGAE